jgi:hypothetical protein
MIVAGPVERRYTQGSYGNQDTPGGYSRAWLFYPGQKDPGSGGSARVRAYICANFCIPGQSAKILGP